MNMKRRIRVSYGRTINTGNYESKRLDLSIETDIDDSDLLDESYKDLLEQLKLNFNKMDTT